MNLIISILCNKYLKLLEKDQTEFHAFVHEILDIYHKNQDIPLVKEMYEILQPMVVEMDAEYAGKGESYKERKEKVLNVGDIFDSLNEIQVHKWVVAVEQHFLNHTNEFKSIFSKGEKVFNKGSRDQKIIELQAMINMAKHYPELQAVVTDMETFCNKLIVALSNRNEADSAIKKNIITTGETSQKIAIELYSNQAKLMIQYKTEPEKIIQFIPVKYFKYTRRKSKEKGAKPMILEIAEQTTVEAGITIPVSGKISLYNSGDADLIVWFSPTKDASVPAITKSLAIGNELILDPKTDALPTDRYLFLQNKTDNDGEVEIIFI